MKWISTVAVIAAVALVGCNKPKGPQTKELAGIDQRPLDELSPDTTVPAGPADLTPTYSEPLAGSSTPLIAPGPDLTAPPPPPAPRTHTVQKNDTMWSLAVRYLGDGQRWRDIAAINPDIKPTAMPIGAKLLIPEK